MPWLTCLLANSPPLTSLSDALRMLYSLQCHQREARSFACAGQLLPVCARCLGIYAGLGFAAMVGRPRLRTGAFKTWLLVGALTLALDVATELVKLRPPSAGFRAFTGALLAYGIGLSILQALEARARTRSA